VQGHARSKVTGVAGSDISLALRSTADKLETWWNNKLTDQQSDAVTSFSPLGIANGKSMYSLNGWGMSPLMGSAAEQHAVFVNNRAAYAPRSVTIDNHAYYAHEA
jgi:hypothetical protein